MLLDYDGREYSISIMLQIARRFAIAVSALIFLLPVGVLAVTSQVADDVILEDLIFSEIKIKNDASGYDEFVELYNNGLEDVDLSLFSIVYYNVSAPDDDQVPSSEKSVSVEPLLLEPAAYYILAKQPSQIAESVESPFSSLKDSEGTLVLVGPDDLVVDPELDEPSDPEVVPDDPDLVPIDPLVNLLDESIVQLQTLTEDPDPEPEEEPEDPVFKEYDRFSWNDNPVVPGVYQLSSSSSNKLFSFQREVDDLGYPVIDYFTWQLVEPTPFNPAPYIEPEEEIDDPGPEEAQQGDVLGESDTNYLQIFINELFPNPEAPQSDSNDEFAELFNPNKVTVSLKGYQLQTGSTYAYKFTFTTQIIEPSGYLFITSGKTNLSLANSSGQARLLDPTKAVISETTIYEKAPAGQAWAFINDIWQWTDSPTPGALNRFTPPPVKSKKTSTKKTSSKSSKKSTTKKAAATRASYVEPDELDEIPPLHPVILVGVTAIAVIYAGYEYRQDAANKIHQFKEYRIARSKNRK